MTRASILIVCLGCIGAIACSQGGTDKTAATITASDTPETGNTEPTAQSTDFAWPASLRVMGEGYPDSGDACRRLGESAAVADYLDHTAILAGCPGPRTSIAAQALLGLNGAVAVGEVDGVTLISIPSASQPAADPPGQGADAATVEFRGTIAGNQVAWHSFAARKGQTINVRLSRRGTMYFNLLPPGGGPGDAMYVGSMAIDDAGFFSGVAPKSGQYTIIVYLMGNDKDSGASRSYKIEASAE